MTSRMPGQDPEDVTQIQPPSPAERLAHMRSLADQAAGHAADAKQHAYNADQFAADAVKHADAAMSAVRADRRRKRVTLALACLGAGLAVWALARTLGWL